MTHVLGTRQGISALASQRIATLKKSLLIIPLLAFSLTSCTSPANYQAEPQDPISKTSGPLNLPTIPWEGGASYWSQFEKTHQAGWDDDSFFPIVIWFSGISSDSEVQYDKSVGFNTYIGLDPATPYKYFEDNDVYWIGNQLNETFSNQSRNWVGTFLGDEVDGLHEFPEGQEVMRKAAESNEGSGRFGYTNYTQMVMAKWMPENDALRFVNDYSDVVSIDMYWYTVPFCSQIPFDHNYLFNITPDHCRISASYGKTMDALRERDLADGKLQRLWQFVEIYNGGPGVDADYISAITPGQLKGAVMNSLIHEARGIVYFNQSLSGKCMDGNIVRRTQVVQGHCAQKQIDAATEINGLIHKLAPVLNSQSYEYSFGDGLDTMLKIKDGYAYIFTMLDDTGQTGVRELKLPPAVEGRIAEVLDENREIKISENGTFPDTFEKEYTYHVYKVKL